MVFDGKLKFLFLFGFLMVLLASTFGVQNCRSYINSTLPAEGCWSVITTGNTNTIDGTDIPYTGKSASFNNITLPNGYKLSFYISETILHFVRWTNAKVYWTINDNAGNLKGEGAAGIDYDTSSKNDNSLVYIDNVPALEISSTDMGTPAGIGADNLYLKITPVASWLQKIGSNVSGMPVCSDGATLTSTGCILKEKSFGTSITLYALKQNCITNNGLNYCDIQIALNGSADGNLGYWVLNNGTTRSDLGNGLINITKKPAVIVYGQTVIIGSFMNPKQNKDMLIKPAFRTTIPGDSQPVATGNTGTEDNSRSGAKGGNTTGNTGKGSTGAGTTNTPGTGSTGTQTATTPTTVEKKILPNCYWQIFFATMYKDIFNKELKLGECTNQQAPIAKVNCPPEWLGNWTTNSKSIGLTKWEDFNANSLKLDALGDYLLAAKEAGHNYDSVLQCLNKDYLPVVQTYLGLTLEKQGEYALAAPKEDVVITNLWDTPKIAVIPTATTAAPKNCDVVDMTATDLSQVALNKSYGVRVAGGAPNYTLQKTGTTLTLLDGTGKIKLCEKIVYSQDKYLYYDFSGSARYFKLADTSFGIFSKKKA